MRDNLNNLQILPLFEPKAAVTDNTPFVSAIIDTQGYDSLTLSMVSGTDADADATFTVLVEDGDASNLSDNAAVIDDELVGLEVTASWDFAADFKTRKIGYIGHKRYVRVTVTPAANTGNSFLGGVAILGHAHLRPTGNPV